MSPETKESISRKINNSRERLNSSLMKSVALIV